MKPEKILVTTAAEKCKVNRTIRVATIADRQFIIDLQKKFSDQLGFLTTVAIDYYLEKGLVTLAQENDCPAGYILTAGYSLTSKLMRPIYQSAVCLDAQRGSLGTQLVAAVERNAVASGQRAMTLWCAEDIEAKHFWKSQGFVQIDDRDPKNTRNRRLLLLRKKITGDYFDIAIKPRRTCIRSRSVSDSNQLELYTQGM